MISLRKITKHYELGSNIIRALDGVDFTINKGEYVAIMGPSGSGKSTLMNIIGCLDFPTGGTYTLDSIEVGNMTPDQRARIRNERIGFVFQQFNLLARTPAIKQVSLPLMYAGMSRRDRKVAAETALKSVGLGDRIDHKPDELSGGQQQRVAIARALATQPSIILADEPTGALDSQTGLELLNLLDELNGKGMTLIIVTHDSEVASRAKRTITLRDGLILSDTINGTAKKMRSQDADPEKVKPGKIIDQIEANK